MKCIENTKAYLGRRTINSYLRKNKRQVNVCNINNAKTIGILFNATHQISFDIVKEMVKNIANKKNKIEVLGYVDSKNLIDHYLYRKGFDFFTHKQLNWYYKPVDETVHSFIEKKFDILINLSLDEPYPIQYIVALSKARFKVGKYSLGNEYLDFMIDIEKEKEAMKNLRKEIIEDKKEIRYRNKEVERIVNLKAQTEIQLNFLIAQILHYLALIKN
ncbi:MAG: hypothetical protein JXB24_08805 [Bacteroidales bacterium]|nr:hypothetical protein [Bacteroidales bacterium]